jgi:hypothetical protein
MGRNSLEIKIVLKFAGILDLILSNFSSVKHPHIERDWRCI